MTKRAFITGAAGQDGRFLSRLLLSKGYVVHGYARRDSEVEPGVVLHIGDLADPAALRFALSATVPSEIYNLGAQSHVGASFADPIHTFRVTAEPVLTILEWALRSGAKTRVYQASTSELFGTTPPPQNERSPFAPQSPYAIAKLAAHQSVNLYREAYGLFAVSGILFNHESETRPPNFVTRKITQAAARIALGLQDKLELGNLEAKRDWGYAGDYVEAMWLMLQQDTPRDFVVASGSTHTVQEFVEAAFGHVAALTNRPELRDWQNYVQINDKYKRPAEVPVLLGNASAACEQLGWRPRVNFKQLVELMVENDLKLSQLSQSSG